MQISLNNIGKRYNYEWIFRGVNHEFNSNENYVILGSNGSGKSTLLQVIGGNLSHSEGEIGYLINDTKIASEQIFEHIAIATPYQQLFEEFTLKEAFEFHRKFKPLKANISTNEAIELLEFNNVTNKEIRHFSSGMKQRAKLGLAILSDTPLLLLDEPTSNLDKNGIKWYQNLVNDYSSNRLIIVCSNQQEHEYEFCTKELLIEDYK